MKVIDAKGVIYRELNNKIKAALLSGENEITLNNIGGQRYIGDGLSGKQRIIINGTPGNDTAAYMDGLELIINGNAQDALANTMNDGNIIVYGNAGDTVGYAMRGGEIFIKGNVGYRVGIHMKEYHEKRPVIVIGGKAGDFFGEYMAGGIMLILGLNIGDEEEIVGNYCGTGMHGGAIYIRGDIEAFKLGKEVKLAKPDQEDIILISTYVKKYCKYFEFDYDFIMNNKPFYKLYPYNKRPYGNLYAY